MRPGARTSPLWVRELPDATAHAICGRFALLEHQADLSTNQEWLFGVLLDELEWRRRNTYPVWRSCSCQFCVAPFTGADDDAE